MLFLDLGVNFAQVGNEFLLLVLFPKHVWHLFLESTDDVGMDLG